MRRGQCASAEDSKRLNGLRAMRQCFLRIEGSCPGYDRPAYRSWWPASPVNETVDACIKRLHSWQTKCGSAAVVHRKTDPARHGASSEMASPPLAALAPTLVEKLANRTEARSVHRSPPPPVSQPGWSPCRLELRAATLGLDSLATAAQPFSPGGEFGCCAGSFSSLAEELTLQWRRNVSTAFRWPAPDTQCGPDHLSYGCVFEPITSCSLDTQPSSGPCSSDVQFIHHGVCERGAIHGLALRSLASMLRLRPDIRRRVDEQKQSLRLPDRYIALQIRGGDKPGTESMYSAPSDFLDAAVEASGAEARDFDAVFLMTDDFSMAEAMRDATMMPILTMAQKESRLAGKTATGFHLYQEAPSVDRFVQFWAESELAANASVLVGSMASNVGRWTRVLRESLSHPVAFRNVDPPVALHDQRNADIAAARTHECSLRPRHVNPMLCKESWHRVVVELNTVSLVSSWRSSAIAESVVELVDAIGVLLAANVAFKIGCRKDDSRGIVGSAWSSEWSCAFSETAGGCPATMSISARAINHAASDSSRLAHLYNKLGVRRPLPSNGEEHLLRACIALSLTPFALGYGFMQSYCSRLQLRRTILRRYLCLRGSVRALVDDLKHNLTQPWIDLGRKDFVDAPATQPLVAKRHLYDAFQIQREPNASEDSLAASLVHGLYRSLSRFPYFGRSSSHGHIPAASPRQQDMGLFILADDVSEVAAIKRSASGFPNTFYDKYVVGMSFITDPLTHDPTRSPHSDAGAFAHVWASVELAAEARWLFTTASSRVGALVEAIREPSEREPAIRVHPGEEPSA